MYKRDEFQVILGSNIRRLRMEKELTVEQLGLESGVGYSQISRIELGKRNPTAYTLFIISISLDVNPSEFFKIQNKETRNF
jgi:transcriptional regulator with XRE-family HTH domain